MTHRYFCTLFDLSYAAKGLALHGSLVKHSSEPFTLYILAMDMDTFWLLEELKLNNVEVIPLASFESAMHLKDARENRTWAEFCWTCASSLMEFLLRYKSIDLLTYLDSDLFFFADPKVIFDEIGDRSIAIVPHRFAPENLRLLKNGVYNVGWLSLRNDGSGQRCVVKWGQQCREWCYSRNEVGRFGDQKYLDSWADEYGKAVQVIHNIGVGVAPWNISAYQPFDIVGEPWITDGRIINCPVVLYHFHEFQGERLLTYYRLRPEDKSVIYAPYIHQFSAARARIQAAQDQIKTQRNISAEQAVRA